MDIYSNRIPDSFRLIKGLFFIMLTSGIIGGILFFTLNILETAKVSSGEVFSDNAPKQYLAPFQAEVKNIHVREGNKVKQGDVLIELFNGDIISNYEITKKELDLKKKNIELIKQKLDNLGAKINIQKKELSFVDSDAGSQKRSLKAEITSLAKQLNSLREQLRTSKLRIDKDYQLFRRGAISEQEFNDKNKKFLDERNYFTELENKLFQKKNTLDNMGNTRSSSIEKKNLDIISTQSQELDLQKTLAREESERLQLEQQLEVAKKEVDNLTIVAEIDGYASAVFNLRRDINFVSKGHSLVVLSPLDEVDFLARLVINEKEMKDIVVGQKTRLKVDAYNHYQYGVIEGEVIQINKDENNIFYVIADINEDSEKFNLKSGYKVKGEIVLNRIKLYQYAFKKIFKKV